MFILMRSCIKHSDMKKTSSNQYKINTEYENNNLLQFSEEFGSGDKINHDQLSFNDDLTVSPGTDIMPPESKSGTNNSKKNNLKVSTGGNSALVNDFVGVIDSEPSIILSANLKAESNLTKKHSDMLNILKEDKIASLLNYCTLEDDPKSEETTKKFLQQPGSISPEIFLPCAPRRKLLVLDLNGFLADIVNDYHTSFRVQTRISGKPIFKRPFCDDFLKFCFEKFDIGVWSSRRKYNVESIVDYLLGEFKHKLLFCWDQSKCTDTGFTTLENNHKPLVLKELKKIWNKEDFGLPCKEGEFSPSNTLLLDDSPYKALLNPPHTAIFPQAYHYNDLGDNSLGPGGAIRVYLEQLALTDDVQNYVKEHPFGQPAITASNPHWNFYSKIISKQVAP